MNVFGWNYPAGAENDPAAPWNQRDPEACETCEDGLVVCAVCKGVGQCFECDSSGKVRCDDCDGTGEETKPSREEIAIEKADRARDEAKDAQLLADETEDSQ